MSVRFRIRTSQGQEISFASHDMFAEFVRSGDLSPDDVVYDAETREWSSALTHPVVLQIETDTEEDEEEVVEVAADGADAEEAVAPAEDDIGLELAPAQSQLTPEEESAAFVKKMEAERASTFELDDEPALQGFTMEQGSAGLLGELETVEPAPPTAPSPPPAPPARKSPEAPRREAPTRRAPKSTSSPPKKKKKKKGSGAGRKYTPLVIVGVMLLGAAAYFGPQLFAPAESEGNEVSSDAVVLPPPPPPLIPDTEDALRARAQERFLTTTRALLRDLPPIPQVWLTGEYLAAPSDYPEVRASWNDHLTTIRQLRAGDNERYRAGYLRALDDARVEGSSRTLRLASAISEFQGRVERRATHYDRVEALARVAIQGHDALLEAEGTIAYEPAAGQTVSGDPVIEAVGRNQDAQAFLEQVLDLILAELHAPDGPSQAANVGEWTWDGILDAVTN